MEKIKGLRYKRTLYVGLGGAGAKTLRKLKQKIKDANDGEIPKQIKFLIIDTNATELSNFRDFDSSEKICIAVREPYLSESTILYTTGLKPLTKATPASFS